MKHHLTLCRAGRLGSWATCSCGWRSRTFVGVEGAHLAFGEHLVESSEIRNTPGPAAGGESR